MTVAPTPLRLPPRAQPRSWAGGLLAGVRRLSGRAGAAAVLATACLLGHGQADALGFGRLSVQSSLGQPLQAQIQVTSLSAAEQASLRLRVASPQVHQTAGLAFDEVLASLRVELVRQADGSFVVELASDRPVSSVYVDLILEARWAAGQRLMGYTLLVNPEGAPPPPVAQVSPLLGGEAPDSARQAAPTGAAVLTSQHTVKFGETLSQLAQQYRPEGVSLDQMLVALYQANPQAFMGENMNRLKTGAVLKLPGAEAARELPAVPARGLIEAHSADFAAYRSRMATRIRDAAAEPPASRQARGQVHARVQDRKEGAVLTPDQLKLSQGGVRAASSPEAALSRDAAAREAAQREAELARNVQALKDLQRQVGASSVTAGQAPAAAPPTEAASVPEAAPTVAVAVPEPASAVAAASAAAPVASAASAASAPVLATLYEPDWLQVLLEGPLTVSAAAGLVMLMALWGGYRLWRGRRSEGRMQAPQEDRGVAMPVAPPAQTQEAPPEQVAAVPEVIEPEGQADDLDPVAEADVHLSYGNDERAAAVLRAAIEEQPNRLDLHVKLLEVMALQRDSMSFEPLALEVQKMTGGEGPIWQHVKDMGKELDPYNPLFGGKQADLTGYESTPGGGQPAFDADGELARKPDEPDLEGFGEEEEPERPALQAQPVQAEAAEAFEPEDTLARSPEPDLEGFGTDDEMQASPEPDYGKSRPMQAGLEPEYESVEAEKFGVELGDPLAREDRQVTPGEVSDFQRPAVEVPEVDLGEEESAPEQAAPVAAPPPPADPNHPLERKLALAKEFLEIGDMDGARDLLDEVYAQATGPLKDSASLLLDTME